MREQHRQDTPARRHYTFAPKVTRSLKPRFVYSGTLEGTPEWRDSEHVHRFCEILFVRAGSGTVYVNGVRYLVKAGDLIVYNAETPHLEYADPLDPFEVLFCAAQNISLGDLPENCLLPADACPVRPSGEQREFLDQLFCRLAEEPEQKQLYFKEIAEDLLKVVIHLILRLSEPDLREINLLFSQVKEYIDAHFAEELTLDGLCARFFVSKSYLSHLFRELAGCAPMRYLARTRIAGAQALLRETSLSVAAIAERCGYADSCYFCRVFKAETGRTPAAYRRAEA